MANTFKQATKSSLVTDAVSSTNTNIVTAGNSSTLIILNALVANKTTTSANVDVYLVPNSGDNVYLLKSVPVPAGSTTFTISPSIYPAPLAEVDIFTVNPLPVGELASTFVAVVTLKAFS